MRTQGMDTGSGGGSASSIKEFLKNYFQGSGPLVAMDEDGKPEDEFTFSDERLDDIEVKYESFLLNNRKPGL